ncbi:hypothetical protein E2562_030503, partial [Oryza meyeriana var. granulata]
MGCAASAFLDDDDDRRHISGVSASHHIVSHTSSTYGILDNISVTKDGKSLKVMKVVVKDGDKNLEISFNPTQIQPTAPATGRQDGSLPPVSTELTAPVTGGEDESLPPRKVAETTRKSKATSTQAESSSDVVKKVAKKQKLIEQEPELELIARRRARLAVNTRCEPLTILDMVYFLDNLLCKSMITSIRIPRLQFFNSELIDEIENLVKSTKKDGSITYRNLNMRLTRGHLQTTMMQMRCWRDSYVWCCSYCHVISCGAPADPVLEVESGPIEGMHVQVSALAEATPLLAPASATLVEETTPTKVTPPAPTSAACVQPETPLVFKGPSAIEGTTTPFFDSCSDSLLGSIPSVLDKR